MTLGAYVRGIAAVLLPLAMAAPVAPVAAEPASEPPVGASSSPGGEGSAPAAPAPVPALRRQAGHRQAQPNTVDRHLQALVKGLKLDAAQQEEVRRALLAQREAIRRLARAPADPEVPRVAVILAINHRTSERIRAVLNDEQKKLYGQPLPRDYAADEGRPSVDEWLKALRAKGRE